jgi:hypothetical protein
MSKISLVEKTKLIKHSFTLFTKDHRNLSAVVERLNDVKAYLPHNSNWLKMEIGDKTILLPDGPLACNVSLVALKRCGFYGRKRPPVFEVNGKVYVLRLPKAKELSEIIQFIETTYNLIFTKSIDGVKINKFWCDPNSETLTTCNLYDSESRNLVYINEYERSFTIGVVPILELVTR